jgi:hypothetical protein
MYESVMVNYNKVNSTTTIPMPRVVFAESCLKIARFLMIVYLHGGWQDSILQKIIQSDMTNPVKLNGDRFINTEDLVKCKESGIQRFAIAKWITKIWTIDVNDMALIDQVCKCAVPEERCVTKVVM